MRPDSVNGQQRSTGALLILAAAGTLLGQPVAAESEAPAAKGERIHTVRPGDTLSSIASSRLGRASAWKRLQSLNRIADPRALRPGAFLYLPPARGDTAVEAEALLVKGDVRVRRGPDDPAASLSSGARLGVGTLIETGASGLLTLRFADGSRMLVSPNSRLRLTELQSNAASGATATRATLEAGDVESTVMRLRGVNARYEMKTPSLNLAVRGTVFRVQFDDQTGEARAMVSEGEVKAGNALGETAIPAGSGTTAARGRAPAKPRALLPAPRLDAPAATVDTFPLSVSWQPMPEASRYRVELFDGTPLDRLVDMSAVEGSASRWPRLPNGEYRVRVRGVDDRKLEGANAEATFRVQAWPAAPPVAAPADDAVVTAERVKFRWARALDTEYLRFQVARDPAFAQPVMDVRNLTGRSNGLSLPLAPGRYFWRIAAGSAAEGPGPFGPTQSFEVRERTAGDEAVAAPLRLRWRAGAPGERYVIQMARRSDFAAPLVDVELSAAEAAVPAGAGPLYIRIKRIAPDGFAGEFEAAHVFDAAQE